jgi:hypothetical protein
LVDESEQEFEIHESELLVSNEAVGFDDSMSLVEGTIGQNTQCIATSVADAGKLQTRDRAG